MTATEYVILVNEQDQPIGIAEKLDAHEKNLLHRAFSVFIFRRQGDVLELLLQQRALHKYHSPGLWTNTCCSHPRPGEAMIAAGERRLREEMGLAVALKEAGQFHYNAHFSNGLSENEIDHVLVGTITPEDKIKPNAEEVHAYRWVTVKELRRELEASPEQFTPWLAKALEIVMLFTVSS
ncbi:MAG: isopentenyl-diphosphate Delta-isomerase [Gammaproteobacteria bacterium]|nr:MAG: isopentenyl-diphosphate Delta-isomerase [Gammaproteobacteria bacterium]